jgi:hypothetical protein
MAGRAEHSYKEADGRDKRFMAIRAITRRGNRVQLSLFGQAFAEGGTIVPGASVLLKGGYAVLGLVVIEKSIDKRFFLFSGVLYSINVD